MSFGFPSGGLHIPYMGNLGPRDYKNEADQEIIGVKEAVLFWISNYGTGTNSVAGGGFTATTFDTTAYSDGSIIKLNNDSGGDRKIKSVSITGKPVVRYSGEKGLIHDDFVDYDLILRDGEKKLEFGNNYIVTQAQLESLADHYWKANNYKRHVYELEIPGRCYWYCPGEWYTVQIGGAGQAEYINSVCECYDVQVEAEAGGLGRTIISFREIYQNWVKDSGALARFLGSGSPKDKYNFARVLVASQYYPGPSDYRCDGTADQAEIQAAIDQVAGFGGGVVELTEGQFNTTAAIDLSYDNIALVGTGAKTIVEKNCDDYAIKAIGTLGNEIKNIIVEKIQIQSNILDTNSKPFIFIEYIEGVSISEVVLWKPLYMGILAQYSSGSIDKCTIDGNNGSSTIFLSGIGIVNCHRFNVIGNIIKNIKMVTGLSGTNLIYCEGEAGIISNNHIYNVVSDGAGVFGIYAIDDTMIQSNKIDNVRGYYTVASTGYGIGMHGDRNKISNNMVRNCDWGIYIQTGNNNSIMNNNCEDNGNIIDHANCESADAPHIVGDGSSVSNCTFARNTDQKYAGSYSYKLTKTIAAGTAALARFCDNADTDDLHELIAGKTYKLSAYIYMPTASGAAVGEARISIAYYDSASWTYLYNTSAPVLDEWTYVETVEVTIPASATGARARAILMDTAEDTEYFYVDNIRLQPIGIFNDHNQNYLDSGTDTYAVGNSWQGPGA